MNLTGANLKTHGEMWFSFLHTQWIDLVKNLATRIKFHEKINESNILGVLASVMTRDMSHCKSFGSCLSLIPSFFPLPLSFNKGDLPTISHQLTQAFLMKLQLICIYREVMMGFSYTMILFVPIIAVMEKKYLIAAVLDEFKWSSKIWAG